MLSNRNKSYGQGRSTKTIAAGALGCMRADAMRLGSLKTETETMALHKQGYRLLFAVDYDDQNCPKHIKTDLGGWLIRRQLRGYCAEKNITDYKIYVNRGYQADLHGGRVYELYALLPV